MFDAFQSVWTSQLTLLPRSEERKLYLSPASSLRTQRVHVAILLHALYLLPPSSPHLPLLQRARYLNSWHDYMPTGPHPNHPPTDNSSHHHPDDHSHDQLFHFAGLVSCISLCRPKQPSLQSVHHGRHWQCLFLDLSGRLFRVSCRGQVFTSSALHSGPPRINVRGHCSLPYTQPCRYRSSSHMVFHSTAMQMTPSYSCCVPEWPLSPWQYLKLSLGHICVDAGPPPPT